MKKLLRSTLVALLALALACSCFAKAPEEYEDLPQGWSHDAMEAAVQNGLLNGVTETRLDPKGTVTRAQAAAMITRAFGGKGTADLSVYTDLRAGAWYVDEVSAAIAMGVLEGSGALMMPEKAITRQETALMLARALRLTQTDADLSLYTDAAKIASWAKDGVCAMLRAGYMQGSGTELNPTNPISREEFAQLLYNIVCDYFCTAGTYTDKVSGNVMINVPGVVLKNMTVPGDLFIGDGVGDGDVTLEGVRVNGRVLVRGGGANSIHISGSTLTGPVVIARCDGVVRVVASDGSEVPFVTVADGSDKVVLSGELGQVTVESDIELVLDKATVTTVNVTAEGADVKAAEGTAVGAVVVTAPNASVTVEKGAAVTEVTSSAENTSVGGEGTVKAVTAKEGAKAMEVTTVNTTLTNNSSEPITTASGALAAGESGKTSTDGTLADPNAGGSGGGGGGSSSTTYYSLTLKVTDTTEPTKTLSKTSTSLLSDTVFYTEAAKLINSARTELKTIFNDDTARAVLEEGLSKVMAQKTDWDAFYESLSLAGDSNDIAALKNQDVKLSALSAHTITLTYKENNADKYEVVITVSHN